MICLYVSNVFSHSKNIGRWCSTEFMHTGTGAQPPGFESQFCYFLAEWLWASHLTSLCLCFLICNIELIHRVVKIKWVSTGKELATGWQSSTKSCIFFHLKNFSHFYRKSVNLFTYLNLIFWMLCCTIRKAVPKRCTLQWKDNCDEVSWYGSQTEQSVRDMSRSCGTRCTVSVGWDMTGI